MDIFPEGTLTAMSCMVMLVIAIVSFFGIGIGVFIGWWIWATGCANAVV